MEDEDGVMILLATKDVQLELSGDGIGFTGGFDAWVAYNNYAHRCVMACRTHRESSYAHFTFIVVVFSFLRSLVYSNIADAVGVCFSRISDSCFIMYVPFVGVIVQCRKSGI